MLKEVNSNSVLIVLFGLREVQVVIICDVDVVKIFVISVEEFMEIVSVLEDKERNKQDKFN